MSRIARRLITITLLAAACMAIASPAHAQAVRTWIGGNNNWADGAGNNANWSGSDEPDSNDDAAFTTGDSVNLSSNNSVAGLTMSGGIDLNVNNNNLTVDGLVELTGAGTELVVGSTSASLAADSVTINASAIVELDGGNVTVNEETGNGLFDINAGGTLTGHGTIDFGDAPAIATSLLVNDGTIRASRAPAVLFGAPQAGTLAINAADPDARLDLDGGTNNGTVTVSRNQTLDINVPLANIFSGDINLFHNSALDISSGWTLGVGTIDIDNGFVPAVFPSPSIPAGVAVIKGGGFAQNDGVITVLDADGTLQFDAQASLNVGSLVNNGHVIFNANATIGAVNYNLTMPTSSSSLTVNANRTVTVNQANFNLDGANALTNVITVEAGGSLNIATTDYDPDQATNAFDGTITLNSGLISVTTSDAEFVMDGTLNMNKTTGTFPTWSVSSEPLDIGNDSGVLDADLNVSGAGTSQINAQVDFNSDADVNIAAGAALQFISSTTVNFDTVNGGNNAEFTGAGEISFAGTVNVNEAVTLNMVGGTVDLDGTDNTGDFINIDAPLTINAASMSAFGTVNGMGVNTLDINSLAGTGSLTVNLDNAVDEWTLNAAGVMNLVNDGAGGTLLAGSDVNLNGTVNVTGSASTTARVDIAGTINVAAASALGLQGGSLADPNRLVGGTVNGPGFFSVSTGRALRGFGTINTIVNSAGTAEFLADDGELTIDGNLVDAGKVGTADADGVLNVVNAWNSTAIDNVILVGGELKGGIVTVGNANGIQGHGLLSAPIVNNTRVQADTGTLVVETPGNNNDWDGAADTGVLRAANGQLLELRDVGAAFAFGGTVQANPGGRVFTNGFGLNFQPGSTLNLGDGGIFEATSSTDLGGTVTVAAGAESRIKVENNFFLSFESTSATTLNGDLRLENNNIIIEDGATFIGSGALIVPDGSHMVINNLADVGVLLDMQGALRPGNSNGIGRINLFDYQQSSTGKLFVDLTGTGLNQFDRLVASGDVLLDGYLDIDIENMFVPAMGNTFNIITGNSVSGQFDFADVSGMPDGLTFHINYLPNAVQLQVVATPSFSADFDNDGDVDSTDLSIWRGAFNLNQLGDSDGDNDSDGRDFLAWQRQLGSAPVVSAATAVPEPGSAALLAMALGALGRCGRRVPHCA